MIGPGQPGQTLEAIAEGFACGQAGTTLTVTIDDGEGNNVVGPTTASIVELECGDDGFAVYRYLGVFPADASDSPYVLTWEGLSASDPSVMTTASETIEVEATTASVPLSGGVPCQPWVTSDEVADCCESFAGGTDPDALALLEPFADAATDILYALSGGKFKGECGPITVRPCNDSCTCWGMLDSGWAWDRLSNRWYNGLRSCGCRGTSEVHLSGWPRDILAVRIDGVPLAPDEYRLDDGFKLVRMRDPADPSRRLTWPGCQIIDLDDTEEGTFAIDYTYGVDPPQAAKDAAVALACQLFAACNPASGRCALPTGVRALARAGVTMNLESIGDKLRGGNTGILAIDAFIARYGASDGEPTVWSPDIAPYPRRVGQIGT